MSAQPSDEVNGTTSGPPLFEFVDPPHEVTDEERNRPRYGRPVRKPSAEPPAPEPKPSAE